MADLKGRVNEEPNKHQGILELLPWYLNGTLEAEERVRVQGHLRECRSCQQELDEMRGLQAAVIEEMPDLSEVFLQDALEAVRSRPVSQRQPAASQAQPMQQPEKPVKERRFVLRPRLAFSFSMLTVVVLAVGVYIGTLLVPSPTVIGDRPETNELGSAIVGGAVVVTRPFLQQGEFTTKLGADQIAKENFSLERTDDSNLRLSSDVVSIERLGAGESAVQELRLTPEYRPIQYLLKGSLVYEGNRAETSIAVDHAIMIRANETESLQRRVELADSPVLYDFSVMSHFELIYRAIAAQLKAGVAIEDVRLTALTPQALRSEAMQVVLQESATLQDPNGIINVTHYRLQVGSDAESLWIDLYATSSELIAVYMPKQPRLATTAGIFAYRSDLYPELMEPVTTTP